MLDVQSIDLHYGAAQALRGVSLQAKIGEVTCVLGRNGVGKTSLLGALAGPAGSQEPPTRSIVLQIVEREVRGSDVAGGPVGVVRVDQGDEVEIRWSSDEGATVHLHGYDIETVVPAEGEAAMRFAARATGRFPIEAHGIGGDRRLEKTLLYLEVHPR